VLLGASLRELHDVGARDRVIRACDDCLRNVDACRAKLEARGNSPTSGCDRDAPTVGS